MDPTTTSTGGSSSKPSRANHPHPNGARRGDKDKPCNLFRNTGQCRFGVRCKFSHDRSQDTTSPVKTPPKLDPAVRKSEDKLRTWLRFLDRSHLSAGSQSDTARFFQLALDLMDGDLGASQQTIRKLSTDPGLAYIKNLADRSILEAADPQAKINLWQTQIKPLFDLVTHTRAVDSNVLEQEVTIIHGFILGVNCSRAAKLFDFVLDIAQAWPERTRGYGTLMAVLETSLAVLFRLVDCNTTTIVNETFHRLLEQFDGLVATSSQPDEQVSKLQATKYLDYLRRRLGVGKKIPDAKAPQVAVVQPEEFVLLQDLPGQLSRDGPRHDNDHADISQIKIMPTYQEITATRTEYLPTTSSSQWHIQGIRGRVDREFRLLREDTVGQLRDAVNDMLQRIRNPGHQMHGRANNAARTSTYDNATVQGLLLNKDKGLELTVRCRQPDLVAKMTNKERQLWWDECKRLRPGALACVLDTDGMILFLVVADSTLRSEQDAKKNDRSGLAGTQGPKERTLSSEKDYLYVKMHLASNSSEDTARVLTWAREIGSPPNRRLVEFPGVLLASFQYTLEALQDLSRKPDLPFTDLIAPSTPIPAEGVTVSPPLFARAPGFTFDLQCLAIDGKAFSVRLSEIPTVEEVSTRTGLDSTQSEALLNMFTREVSLIQGPPGTGKSYTGEKILKALLANKKKSELGPVICVCYTNHALDQLLEHLLDDGIDGIIRMGSRSKSERLENVNIRVVAEKMAQTRTEQQQAREYTARMRDLESEVTGLLDQLSNCTSLSSVRAHLSASYPAHSKELFSIGEEEEDGFQRVQNKKRDPIRQWLHGGYHLAHDGRRPPRPVDALKRTPLADMSRLERSRLHDFWLKSLRDPIITELIRTLKDHDEARDSRNRVRQEVRRRCLQQANIIGVTTTGLARELRLLRKLRTKVMLCEEAGEVLEAHVLTALLPSVEQTILIGDHEQLRPQIQNYQLQSTNPRGVQYSLDVSLFERLVQPPRSSDPRLPISVLETQRRMHPSIAEMVRSTLYKTLKDSGNVFEYPEVVGMRRRLFWLHHETLEAGAALEDAHNTSHSNDYEVEMTACLVSHLVRQGKYSPEDIAVLTPYLGQLQKLRHRMAAEATFAVSLDDRDLDELEQLGTVQPEKPALPHHLSVAKTTLARSIRLATVDNFQGEEAKVVIISLVRSNPQNRCGFLSTSNRINVLLSRAKHGCYIIGNSNTYRNVQMWNQIIQLLQANNNFGYKLELQCPRHPQTPILVSQPDHFVQLSPDAGCTLPCDRRLECGHACNGPCHSDLVHKAVKCLEECPRTKKGCDHPCPLLCGDPCQDKCHFILKDVNLELPCGHILKTAECWQVQDPASVACRVQVQKEVPGCGHTVIVPCLMDVTKPDFKCMAECGQHLPCGHTCHSVCWKCNIREDGQITLANHGICKQACDRNFTTCQHTCQKLCHGESKCAPCDRPCEARCSHSRCSKLCHEPCAPCAEQVCASRCPHGECTMPCAAPCDWVPCSKRCMLPLSCGHQCPSLCGEACPDARFCQVCGSQDVLSTVVDLLEMKEYREIALDETPCIFPDCGHFLTLESMDGQMSMREHYELDENDIPTGILAAAKPFSMDEVKVCSACRGSLRSISRYGRIVRRAMLDEATKKFISWSVSRHLELAEGLITHQKKLEQSADQVEDVGRAGRLALTGDVFNQITNLRKWTYLNISKFVNQASVEEQPFHRVFEFVSHARRNKATGGALHYDQDIIQLRGYLLALALLLQCSITVLSDFSTLRKASGVLQTKITIDFAANFDLCNRLIQGAVDTSRPQLQAEGHIYSAQLCGFALSLDTDTETAQGPNDENSIPGAFPEGETAAARDVNKPKETQHEHHEHLKSKGIDHLTRARDLLSTASADARKLMEAEITAAENMLNGGVFYRPVTTDEMRAVYAAMAAEFRGTGHWYTCERGHPFTVGECGMPMEQARCPECGSPVGGQGHVPAEGVRRADAMEELARGVGNMGI